jgi:hypothetical protein
MPPAMKLLFLSALLAVLPLSAPARPFTNQKGQSFEATVVSVDSTAAELMGKDGKKYKVALSTLCESDQKFCKDWLVANPPIKLTVKIEGFAAKGTRQTNNESSGGGGESLVARTRTLQEGYRITVSNWSKDPGAKVGGLTVEYAIVVGFSNTAGKDKRGVKEIVKGSASLPELTGTKAQSVETKTVGTGQSAAVASSTTTDSDGDSRTSTAAAVDRESMDGICLVIKHGSRIVATQTTGRVSKEVQTEMMK